MGHILWAMYFLSPHNTNDKICYSFVTDEKTEV